MAQYHRTPHHPDYRDEQYWLSQWVRDYGLDWASEVEGVNWMFADGNLVVGQDIETEEWVFGEYARGFVVIKCRAKAGSPTMDSALDAGLLLTNTPCI